MTATNVPDVDDTDLTRDEMEEIAEEYGIDADGLDDQQLLERLGVALGEIEESEVVSRDGERGAGGGDESSGGGLREVVATKLQGAADKLWTDSEEPSGRDGPDEAVDSEPDDARATQASNGDRADQGGGSDDVEAGTSEQDQPGEPIEGPTRNELRDELRELGLPLSGTKAELQQRLDEARDAQDAGDENVEDAGGSEGHASREDSSEQDQPGEPIEGPTRNELRDELRELGLPLSGTKAELQQRLDEARGDQDGGDDGDGDAEDEDASQDRMDWLRQKVSKRLASTADRVSRESGSDDGAAGQGEDQGAAGDEQDGDGGHSPGLRDRLGRQLVHLGERLTRDGPDEEDGDDGDSGGPSKLKRAGRAAWRKITPG